MSAERAADVTIVEVSPRDGLQNEARSVSTADKVRLIERAVAIGLRRIEAAAFVSPRAVPQMADAEEVMAAVPRGEGVSYIGLVLNRAGLERAVAAGVDEVNVVVPASDTFSQRNQRRTVAQMLDEAHAILDSASAARIPATVTVAVAFGCPYEGEVPAVRVRDILGSLRGAGIAEIALADTIGVGVPSQVEALAAIAAAEHPGVPLRFHFHDTRSTGIANALAAVAAGASALDASLGGLGGCPFASGATGNVATEDLVYALARSGVSVATDLEDAIAGGLLAASLVGREAASALVRAGPFPPRTGA
jgi:hydroxymethylglutaryl-CoA lyase